MWFFLKGDLIVKGLKFLIISVLLLAAFCLVSCGNTGDDDGKVFIKSSSGEITTFTGAVGEEYVFEFVVERSTNLDVSWVSSDNEVLTVSVEDVSKNYIATIRCESAGVATVTATSLSGKTASVVVTSIKYEITSSSENIVMYDDLFDLPFNYVETIACSPINSEVEYEFSSENIYLDNNGNIVANEPGDYTITARIKDCPKRYVVTEIEVKPARSFNVDAKNLAVQMGKTTHIPVSTSLDNLIYQVEDRLVARVENDEIIPLKKGNTIVNVYRNDKKLDFINLEVVGDTPSAISITRIDDDLSYINLYGRNYYDGEQKSVVMSYGGAGFEIKFCGTSLSATFTSRLNSTSLYMQVLLDGEKVSYDAEDILKGSIAINGTTSKKYTVVENLPYGVHIIKVLRRSMYNSGEIGLQSVETDGFLMPALKKPQLKIDIYGDSITAGYGICDGISWNSANSNGLLTYGYLLTEKLGAQSNMMGHSGWGVYVSTGNSLNPDTQWYDKIDLIPKSNQSWDLSSYVPDLVIINLGTNDASGYGGNYSSAEFITKYKTMITSILEEAPNAHVILCYGMMGKNSTVNNDIEKVVEQLDNDKVTYLPLENYGCWSASGKNGHPTPEANKQAADYLYDYIVANYPDLMELVGDCQDTEDNFGGVGDFIKD